MNRWWECQSTVCAPGLGFRDFASASSLLLNESQALADFQYLHCVQHPDSSCTNGQIHQASYQLSDTAKCLCLHCSREFLPSGSSCTALCARGSGEMLGMLPLHSPEPAVSISVCTLPIRGCSRAVSQHGTDKSHLR